MPFLIFTFILFFILFFLKKDRKFFFLNIISLLLIFLVLFNNYSVTYKRYLLLKNEFNYEIIKNSLINITNKFNKNNKMTLEVNAYNNVEQKIKFTVGYISIYNAAIHLWYKNPIIGTGVKF